VTAHAVGEYAARQMTFRDATGDATALRSGQFTKRKASDETSP
jgi:hypothetical protein